MSEKLGTDEALALAGTELCFEYSPGMEPPNYLRSLAASAYVIAEALRRNPPSQIDVLVTIYGEHMAYSGHEIATARAVLALFAGAAS